MENEDYDTILLNWYFTTFEAKFYKIAQDMTRMDEDEDGDDDGDNVRGWILKEEDEGCGWIGRRSESKGGWQATLARSHPPHFSPFSSERLFNFPELFADHPLSSLLQPRSSPQPRPPPQLTWLSSWNSKYVWQWQFSTTKKKWIKKEVQVIGCVSKWFQMEFISLKLRHDQRFIALLR